MKLFHTLSAFAVVAVLTSGTAIAQTTTLKGIVSDQMCGAHHMMAGASAAKCTRECIGMGAPYALVVGNKVYTLKADAQEKKKLNALAGASAVITGTVSGTTVQVASVAPGR